MAKPEERKRASKKTQNVEKQIIDEDDELIKQKIIEYKKIISEWLVDEGIFRQKVNDPETFFNYKIEFPRDRGLAMHIAQQKDMNDSIVIVWNIRISPEHKTKLDKLDNKEKMDFFREIRNNLLLFFCSFRFYPNLSNPSMLQLSTQIYYDGLTKDRLMKEIVKVYTSGLSFIWRINDKFGPIPGDSELNDLYR